VSPAAPSTKAAKGWEGFFAPTSVTDQMLRGHHIPLRAEAVQGPLTRVAKLVIASDAREAGASELEQMAERYCNPPDVRAWNTERCKALDARDCDGSNCRYEHWGNCSGLLAGGGLFFTAAHCVHSLIENPSLAAKSVVVVAGADGKPARRLSLGEIRTGKKDFAHDWVALDDADPVDVAAIVVDDGGLAPFPRAPLPAEGEMVFIAGYPRVNGRDPSAMRAAGYDAIHGSPGVSFGRVDDRNETDLPLCNVDGDQEHWALQSDCPGGPAGDSYRGVILRSPFLTTFDSINGYSGGPVFDGEGRWVGINATLISKTNPQERYDPKARMVATPVARALDRLAIDPRHIHGERLLIRPQTSQEAFAYLWRTLQQMPFFRKNGYDVALPEDATIAAIARGDVALDTVNRTALEKRFSEEIYDASSFDSALEALRGTPRILDDVLPVFAQWAQSWGFVLHERYRVLLTLYGPGGSYDSNTGTITLWASSKGDFKGGGGTQTIVHEMVHLGTEKNIVRPLKLTHWEKERLVDRICALQLAKALGGYPMQSKGETDLDPFVNDEALSDLPAAMKRYVEAHPR
jgi:hypothetical protein